MDPRAPAGRRKPLPIFAVQAAVLLWLFAWPAAPQRVYPPLFHAEANLAFEALGSLRAVRLATPAERADGSDTEMRGFRHGRIEPRWTARFKVRERGYGPLVWVAALLLATPNPLAARLASAAAGLALVNLFTLLQVGALALASFGVADAATPGAAAAWGRALAIARGSFNSEMPRAVAVLLVWALLARPGRALELTASPAALRDWWLRR